jgi:hypothetical protein
MKLVQVNKYFAYVGLQVNKMLSLTFSFYTSSLWDIFGSLWWHHVPPTTQLYEVWQFNSRNCHVKAEFVYLCTSGCCRL